LNLDTDESYTLSVQAPNSQLTAQTVYGALRGLETFSQLVVHTGMQYYQLNQSKIVDFPRFAHRGILIDSARHFQQLSAIYKTLDAMAYSKFNVLHWHIVDDQSFPYESMVYPYLAQNGSWNGSPSHIYTQADIFGILQYAQDRGIRVVPEFDTPGHTLSWGNGYPYILTQCYSGGQPVPGSYGPVNPIPNTTFPFMYNFFKEVGEVFPDQYVHIGGDEVSFDCWASNPSIQDWMSQNGYTNYAMVEQYYETNLLNIMEKLDKDYIVWQEIFDNGLKVKPNTVIEVWKDPWQSELLNVTSAGLKAILSTPWYLNYISYGQDWVSYYQVEPFSFNGTQEQNDLVFGGEACMWGEYVDSTNLVSRLFPRASAVGERLWSAMDVTDVNSAEVRLQAHTCRMLNRKISAEPPNGPSFCNQEYQNVYLPPWEE